MCHTRIIHARVLHRQVFFVLFLAFFFLFEKTELEFLEMVQLRNHCIVWCITVACVRSLCVRVRACVGGLGSLYICVFFTYYIVIFFYLIYIDYIEHVRVRGICVCVRRVYVREKSTRSLYVCVCVRVRSLCVRVRGECVRSLCVRVRACVGGLGSLYICVFFTYYIVIFFYLFHIDYIEHVRVRGICVCVRRVYVREKSTRSLYVCVCVRVRGACVRVRGACVRSLCVRVRACVGGLGSLYICVFFTYYIVIFFGTKNRRFARCKTRQKGQFLYRWAHHWAMRPAIFF